MLVMILVIRNFKRSRLIVIRGIKKVYTYESTVIVISYYREIEVIIMLYVTRMHKGKIVYRHYFSLISLLVVNTYSYNSFSLSGQFLRI